MSDRSKPHLRLLRASDPLGASLTSVTRSSRPAVDPVNSSMVDERIGKAAWLEAICERLSDLGDLDNDWDGYGAKPIPRATLHFTAMAMANMWLEGGLPTPRITPMSSEAVMVEWRSGSSDVTLEVQGPNDVLVLIERPDGTTDELHTTSDFSQITKALERTRPQLAVA